MPSKTKTRPKTKTKAKTKTKKAQPTGDYGTLSEYRTRKLYDILADTIDPKGELSYSTSFELLVAVVLSAQATDKGVNAATAKLFPVANTPEAIVELGVDGLIEYIKTIGLFNDEVGSPRFACRMAISYRSSAV